MSKWVFQASALFLTAIWANGADAAAPMPLGSSLYGWTAVAPNFAAAKSGPRPVDNDPSRLYDPSTSIRPDGGEPGTFRVADLSNPILQPWAREELRKINERILGGATGYTRHVSCWPMGVPGFLLYAVAPIFFVQTPTEVWIVTREDHMVRHIYMNVPHSKKIVSSWFGESIGHYEGDTLVVDTVGMNNKTYIDNFMTPHTAKLHVVERFRVNESGKAMDADAVIEDPGTFTTPWHGLQHYLRTDRDLGELVCAENTFHLGYMDPFPEAASLDF